jgi:hypothetical protein
MGIVINENHPHPLSSLPRHTLCCPPEGGETNSPFSDWSVTNYSAAFFAQTVSRTWQQDKSG